MIRVADENRMILSALIRFVREQPEATGMTAEEIMQAIRGAVRDAIRFLEEEDGALN